MMSIQFNGKTVGISFPSSFLRSKRRIPTDRERSSVVRFVSQTTLKPYNPPSPRIGGL